VIYKSSTTTRRPEQNSESLAHPGGGLVNPSPDKRSPDKSTSRRWLPSTTSCLTAYWRRASSGVSASARNHEQRDQKSQNRRNKHMLYTRSHLIRDAIKEVLEIMNLQASYLPNLLVELLPVYSWSDNNKLDVSLSHNNTISSNDRGLFGVVAGPELDPNTDHIISVRLLNGIEFGIGVATRENMSKEAKRDFMCQKGGWGYYNYKTKHQGTRPKYPAGWYSEEHECISQLPEKDIIHTNDVISVVITREGLKCKDVSLRPRKGNGQFTIRYFKNGKLMGRKANQFGSIQGPLRICLNYYFMASTLQLLSDFKISNKDLMEGLRE